MMTEMKTNNRKGLLLVAVAVIAMLIVGIGATASMSDAAEEYPAVVTIGGEIDYGEYGVLSNEEMNNSIGFYFDKATGTYTFYGYLAQQNLNDTDGAFYKMWTDNTDCEYGIAFTLTTSAGTSITIGNGNPTTASDDSEKCLLYIDADGASKTVPVKVGEKTYTFDISGIKFITSAELDSRNIIHTGDVTDTIDLEGDSYLTGTITANTGTITVNLNGYNLLTGARMISVADVKTDNTVNVTINAGNGGSITASGIIVLAYTTGTLTVNGGTYTSDDYAFVWYGDNDDSPANASFKDATIDAECGIWLSNNKIGTATIDNCEITASAIGIYLGTAGDGENQGIKITNTTVNADSTAIEIKSGKVTIDNCILNSQSYELTNGQINNNGSGAGVATVSINNGYVDAAAASGVDVTITNSTLTNSASSTSVQIAVGEKKSGETWVAATGNIEFTTDSVGSNEIALFYSDKAKAEGRTITLEITDSEGTKIETDVVGSTGVSDTQASSGNILIVTSDSTDDSSSVKKLTNGTQLVVSGGATYSGSISVDSTSSVSVNNGTFTGTVTAVTGTATNSIELKALKGSFTITESSVHVNGTLESGEIVNNDSDEVYLDNAVINGEIRISGTGSVILNNVTVNAGGNLILDDGIQYTVEGTLTNNGTITGEGAVIDITAGEYDSTTGTVTATFAHGTRNTVKMAGVVGDLNVTRGSVAINGSITGGTIEVLSGQARLNGALTVTNITVDKGATLTVGTQTMTVTGTLVNNGTVTVAENGAIVLSGSGTITNNAGIELNGAIRGTSSVAINNGTITVLGKGTITDVTFTGTGIIDMSSVSSDGTLGGTYGTGESSSDVIKFPADQNITLTSDTNLVNDITMNFKGTLTVPENMTLTISDTAYLTLSGQTAMLINNGTIIIQATDDNNGVYLEDGAKIVNNGNIVVQYIPEDEDDLAVPNTLVIGDGADGSAIINYGTITASKQTEITINGFVDNAAGATIDLDGYVTSNGDAEIKNAGIININAAVSGQLNINLATIGATVNIEALNGSVFVSDSEVTGQYKNTMDNTISFYGSADHTIGNITVISDSYDVAGTGNKTDVYKTLDISGAVTVAYTGSDEEHNHTSAETAIRLVGDVTISSDFSIGTGTSLKFGNQTGGTADITVSGNMTVTGASTEVAISADADSVLTVTGTITSSQSFTINNLTLNAASYSVTQDVTVGNTTSKVTTYYYTTLENAIASGAKAITVFGNIDVKSEVTIPSGVTVTQDNTQSTGSVITVTEEAVLTVSDGGVLANANVNVEGTLYAENAKTGLPGVPDNNTVRSEVYGSDGTDARYTNLATAMEAAESGDVITLNVAGNGVVIDKTFTIKEGVTVYTNDKPFSVKGATLIINGTLQLERASNYTVDDESTITLNGYIMSEDVLSYDGKKFPAGAYYSTETATASYNWISTVANAAAVIDDVVGTVYIHGAVSIGEVDFISKLTDGAYVNVMSDATVTGTIGIDNVTLTVYPNAKIVGGVTSETGAFVTTSQDVYSQTTFTVSEQGLTVNGSSSGATVQGIVYLDRYVNGTATLDVEGTANIIGTTTVKTLNIEGTVYVDIGAVLNVDGVATVLGTLETKIDGDAKGTVNAANMYIGVENGDEGIIVSGVGTVNGNVTITGLAYVGSTSTAPETFNGTGYINTQFMVENALWMTVYGVTGATVPYLNAPVQYADFLGWAQSADATEPKYPAEETPANIVLGGSNAVLYAVIDYDVYSVTVYTDGGISSVAINGILLNNITGNEFVTTSDLSVGTYKVTYTLKSGFEGTAIMTVGNGATVSGDSFTITGENRDIIINMTGTTPVQQDPVINVPAPEVTIQSNDEMSLTDYLLIVLVILIVIMAIIVALRMMRS